MIRSGRLEDLDKIMEMVSETIKIMKEEKNDQWTELYPTRQIFETDVQNGSLYVLEEEGQVLGSITIDRNTPNEYNNDSIIWRKVSEAYTLHRLVVDPIIRGKGIASRLINHAETIAQQNEVPYIKTDTYSLNTKAQALFEKNGYKKVGEMAFHGKERPFYCYDKILHSAE